jgi:hypothetical protein
MSFAFSVYCDVVFISFFSLRILAACLDLVFVVVLLDYMLSSFRLQVIFGQMLCSFCLDVVFLD